MVTPGTVTPIPCILSFKSINRPVCMLIFGNCSCPSVQIVNYTLDIHPEVSSSEFSLLRYPPFKIGFLVHLDQGFDPTFAHSQIPLAKLSPFRCGNFLRSRLTSLSFSVSFSFITLSIGCDE